MRAIGKNPALTYGLIGLLLRALTFFIKVDYDAGGARGALFWTEQVFGLPFWIISEGIFALNASQAVRGHEVISVALGIILCLVLDAMIRRIIRTMQNRRS